MKNQHFIIIITFHQITHQLVFERPPGVPFQKIQFGNERGGRSVLSRLPDLRIARILALLRCLILRPLSLRRKFVY